MTNTILEENQKNSNTTQISDLCTQYQTQLLSFKAKILAQLQNLRDKINQVIELAQQQINQNKIEENDIIEDVFLYCQPFIENKLDDCLVMLNNQIIQIQIYNTQQQSENNKEEIVMNSTQIKSIDFNDHSTQVSSSELNKYKLKQTIQQKEICFALTFNKQYSIMISGCGENIKQWKIIDGYIQNDPYILYGHTNVVTCLIYSNDERCFISGSDDGDIRLWRKIQPKVWQSTKLTVHRQGVLGVLFNNSNQQIISFGKDPSIHIIKFSEQNTIQIIQTLNKHQSILNCLCINESESILASSDYQKVIMIWVKDENAQWQFKQIVNQSTGDYFCRMAFINNYLICQQWSKPISQVFCEVNGQFIQRLDLQIKLSEQKYDDEDLFPTIYNKKKGILIQKYGRYVYILKLLKDYQFIQVCPPIDCIDQYNYGNLDDDGNNLIIWNYKTMEFRNYDLSLF